MIPSFLPRRWRSNERNRALQSFKLMRSRGNGSFLVKVSGPLCIQLCPGLRSAHLQNEYSQFSKHSTSVPFQHQIQTPGHRRCYCSYIWFRVNNVNYTNIILIIKNQKAITFIFLEMSSLITRNCEPAHNRWVKFWRFSWNYLWFWRRSFIWRSPQTSHSSESPFGSKLLPDIRWYNKCTLAIIISITNVFKSASMYSILLMNFSG